MPLNPFEPKPSALEIRNGTISSHFRHHPHGGVEVTLAPVGTGPAYRLRLNDEDTQVLREFLQTYDQVDTPRTPTVGRAFWDEESQLVRVTVDGIPFNNHGHLTAEDCRLVVLSRRRSAAAFAAMAEVLEGREEAARLERAEAERRELEEEERRDAERHQIVKEVMEDAGYANPTFTGYLILRRKNREASRLVDLAVEARTNLKTVQDALGKQSQK